MTPDAWARTHRFYPASSGVPGPREPSLTPYMIEWGRTIAAGRHSIAVMACGAQTGKTEEMLDVIGERLDNAPAPIIYVGPSKEFCTDQFEPRLMALLDQAPSLAMKTARGKRMKKTRKIVAGVPIRLAHAGSSTALKSDPAAVALVDEYDELLANINGKGDPLGLVKARGYTYPDFTVGVASTPTMGSAEVEDGPGLKFWKLIDPDDVTSPIWKLWQDGTRNHWCWPCLHCEEYFVPRFSTLKWDAPAEGKTTPEQARRTAYIACPSCGGVLTQDDKAAMNARGRYAAPGQTIDKKGRVRGDPPDSSTASYWVSGLASPFVTIGELAEDYLKAVRIGDPARIQTAINAGFGELYAPGHGDAPRWAEIGERKSEYLKGELPEGVVYAIASVDVQKDRLMYLVRGWGARGTSWLLDWGALWGETTESGVWADLADYINSPICGQSIRQVMLDSGFRPGKLVELPLNRVYDFCRQYNRLVHATKGSSHVMNAPLIKSRIEVTSSGRSAKYGLELLRLDTDYFKSWVHERIRWPVGTPGAWYLPADVDDDYLKQLVSEARQRLPSGKVQWVRRSKDNHYLDLEAMQAAGAHLLNAVRIPSGAKRQDYNRTARPPAAPATPPGSAGARVIGPGSGTPAASLARQLAR